MNIIERQLLLLIHILIFKILLKIILETFEDYKFVFIPLNFNLYLHYDNNLDKLWRKKAAAIGIWLRYKRFIPYRYEYEWIQWYWWFIRDNYQPLLFMQKKEEKLWTLKVL